MSVANIDWAALAVAVEERVMNKLHDDLAHWSNDISMRLMFLQDAADSLRVCELLSEGKWKPVAEKLWDMDTAARDCVYDMIEAEAGEDFLDLVRNNH
jgi:uncharacterized protein YPO0396